MFSPVPAPSKHQNIWSSLPKYGPPRPQHLFEALRPEVRCYAHLLIPRSAHLWKVVEYNLVGHSVPSFAQAQQKA